MSGKNYQGNFFVSCIYIHRGCFQAVFLEKGDGNEAEIKGNSNHSIHNDDFHHGAADSVSFDPWLSV